MKTLTAKQAISIVEYIDGMIDEDTDPGMFEVLTSFNISGSAPEILYRGEGLSTEKHSKLLSGEKIRVGGISWSTSHEAAGFFAKKHGEEIGVIWKITPEPLTVSLDVMALINEKDSREILIKHGLHRDLIDLAKNEKEIILKIRPLLSLKDIYSIVDGERKAG